MIFRTKRGWCQVAMVGLVAGLWAGLVAAADPGWEPVANKLRAAQLPAAGVEAVVTHARERGIAPAQVTPWADDMARLNQAGVPASLMAERLVQGLAKGVPVERLGPALEVLRGNLLWARQAVDARAAKAEVRAKPEQAEQALRNLEAALRAGLARAQLDQVFGKQPLTLEQFAALARTAADLRGWGAQPEAVVRALAPAAAAGMGARELDTLERKFAAGVAAGKAAPALLAEFEKGVYDFTTRGVDGRENYQRDIREEMRQEQMRDFKGQSPAGMPEGMRAPSGGMGGGYP